MSKVVVVLSGGMDSVTMLHKLCQQYESVKAISFNYGQRHGKELDCAKVNAVKLGIDHKIVDISFVRELIGNSALTGDTDVPEGHYEDDTMKQTVVPNRNMILASLAIGYAVNEGFDTVALGVHGGDHAIYPDCRPEFLQAMDAVSKLANYEPVAVIAPYLHADKAMIVAEGHSLNVDYSATWTCYKGMEKACGRCGSCVERLEAFRSNELTDPLPYETHD